MKTFLFIIITSFLILGCEDVKIKDNDLKIKNAIQYVEALRVGNVLENSKVEPLVIELHQQTSNNTVWRVWGNWTLSLNTHYFTVDSKTNIIKSIWVK